MDQLSFAKAAMLAGQPQHPYYANPVANFERAFARQRVVLHKAWRMASVTNWLRGRGGRRAGQALAPLAAAR